MAAASPENFQSLSEFIQLSSDSNPLLGEGGFGRVEKMLHPGTSKIYAVKTISRERIIKKHGNNEEKKRKIFRLARQEAAMMSRFNHPNIVTIFGFFDDVEPDRNFYIVMEVMEGGSLLKVINEALNDMASISEQQIISWGAQILFALYYLHGNNQRIVHRDVKSDNIFLDEARQNVKLGDFGLAKQMEEFTPFAHSDCGTRPYMPPEALQEDFRGNPIAKYTYSFDIWSFGVVLYELATLELPFLSENDVRYKHITPPSRLSEPFKQLLINEILQRDVAKRATSTRLCRHPVFENAVKQANSNRPVVEDVAQGEPVNAVEVFNSGQKFSETVDVPSFNANYYNRPEDEKNILDSIVHVCNNPGKGVFVISGDAGVGKTTLTASILNSERHHQNLQRQVLVLWLNCYQWRSEAGPFNENSKESFRLALIKVVRKYDESFDSNDSKQIHGIVSFFKEKHGLHVLFVFDDMFSAELLDFFINQQKDQKHLSCVAITRNPVPLTSKNIGQIRYPIYQLQSVSDEGMAAFLKETCGLEGKLQEDEIKLVVRRCCGLLLIATLIWNEFFRSCSFPEDFREACKTLEQVPSVGDLQPGLTNENKGFANVLELFKFSLNGSSRYLKYYFIFLLFDPFEPIEESDLKLLLSLVSRELSPQSIIRNFEDRSLVRRLKKEFSKDNKTDGSSKGPLFIHQMLFEAARDVAVETFRLQQQNVDNPEKMLQKVRAVILKTTASGEMMLFEVTEQLRRQLLDRILTILSSDCDVLTDVLLTTGRNKQAFIHLLYLFDKWPGNIKYPKGAVNEKFGINYSYRMIAKLLLTMKRSGREDCLKTIGQSTSADGKSSFIEALYDDEKQDQQHNEREALTNLMSSSRYLYGNTDLPNEIRALLTNNFNDFDVELRGYDVESVLFTAVRIGILNVVRWALKNDSSLHKATTMARQTPLWIAAQNGHIEIVKFLVERDGASILTPAIDGTTPLWIAAAAGHIEIVRYIAERSSASISTPHLNGTTPLHVATQEWHIEIVKYIAEKHPASIATPRHDGVTPLWIAALNGHIEMVEYIAERDSASISTPTDDGTTPLWCAARHGHFEIVKYIAKRHSASMSTPTNDKVTPLSIAAQYGHIEIVKFIAERDSASISTPNKKGSSPLLIATGNGHIEIVKYIAEKHPASISTANNDGITPLWIAAQNGHIEIVKYIAERHSASISTPDNDGSTPLWTAAYNGHIEIVKYIAERHSASISTPGKNGSTPLWTAAYNGHIEIVKYIAERHSASISTPDSDGTTPLWIAAQNGHIEIVKFMVERHSASISTPDSDGSTPLWIAAQNGHIEIVKFMAERDSASISTPGKNGSTPLWIAAQNGHIEIVKFMAERDSASISTPGKNNSTPVNIAAWKGHLDVVVFLATLSPNSITVVDNFGYTALASAEENNHTAIVDYLKSIVPHT